MQQLIDLRNETHEAIALQAIGAFMDVGQPAIVLFSGGRLFGDAERCAYDDLGEAWTATCEFRERV